MKILHLLSQIELTGAEVYALTLGEWQKRNGHQVFIVSDELHQKTELTFWPLPVHRTTFWSRRESKKKLLLYMQENNIDVVHAHSRAAVRLAYSCCKKSKRLLVTTLHGRPHRSWSKKLFDIYGDKIISICENLTRDLIVNMKINARKIVTLPNMIDFEKVGLKENRQKTGFHLAVIGRTTGPKGERVAELLQNVFPKLLQHFPDLRIDLVGGNIDRLNDQGQTQFHQLKSTYKDRINNFSHISQLESHLHSYDLIIGAGRVAMAALAAQVPLWALGEAENIGIITADNYQKAKHSNFGDIHHEFLFRSMKNEDVFEKLKNFIGNSKKTDGPLLRSIVLKDYGLNEIAWRITELYKSAIFKKNHPAWIPILMYHKVTDQPLETRHRIFITKDKFKQHLQFFQKHGFETLSFAELKEFRDLKRNFNEFPRKPLILTFDDGYVNNLENAVPLLQEHKFKATFFLLADTNVKSNQWDEADETPQLPLMNHQQRKELAQSGQEIGSHGFSHRKLSQMNREETFYELKESKKRLEEELNCTIPVYAYTYGIKNEFAEEAAREASYTYAVNTTIGDLHLEDNPYNIFRVSIFPEDGPAQLLKKTHPWYRRYYYFKRRQ